jgi:sulfate transport system ATP-binding protein
VVAGLEFPDQGQVLFDDQDMTFASAATRRVGFVFQQYALFRHMTLARNIAFGLDVRPRRERPPKREVAARVEELLKLVELDGMGKRYPAQLSGGQRQRVALARALAVSPRLLLLDEPFGALDATVRKSLRRELRRIHDATGVTTVFVTHDQEEALELADRVAILNNGRIEQVGTPREVHDAPATPFVCGFVGASNRIEGTVSSGCFRSGEIVLDAGGRPEGSAVAYIRPYEIERASNGGGFNLTAHRVTPQGALTVVEGVTDDGRQLEVDLTRDAAEDLTTGATFKINARKAHVYPLA